MNVPNLCVGKFVDSNGYLTGEAQGILSQLFKELQLNLSNKGYVLPTQTAAVIDTFTGDQSDRAMIYDQTNDLFKVNLAGVWKTVQTL